VTPELTAAAIEGFARAVLIQHFDKPSPTPEFHRELWELCCSDHPLVAIAAPRGHAKSTAVSFIYVLAEVLFRKSKFVVLISDTETQAIMFLEQIKDALQTNLDLIQLFGVKAFDTDSKTAIVVRMDDGHRFKIVAKGSGQNVRGMTWDHYRPDLIVGDDLENDEIVMNDERRKAFREWVVSALLPIRGPTGKVRIVGTILHMDSFLARITPVEGERGSVADPNGLKFTFASPKQGDLKAGRMFKGVLYKAHVGGHPSEIKNKSDMLWPNRFPKEWYMAEYNSKAEVGHPEKYAQEYLNRPLDESLAFFRRSDLNSMTQDDYDAIARGQRPLLYYAGGDLAITEKERGDYTAFMVVGIDSDGIMYVMDVIRDRFDGRQIVDEIIKLQKAWKLQWFALEQEKTMKSVMPFLRETMLKEGSEFVNVIPIIPHVDKTARAHSMQGRMRIKAVKFDKKADWWPTLESELLQFPRGKHDDQVDAMSCIGLALQKIAAANTYAEEREFEIQEQEEKNLDGNDGRSAICGY
jgi:predicted phage terminase large subunit-like protein